MIKAFFLGLLAGIPLCSTFGTVFFSLLQNSVDNGYRAGIKIAFGVVVCDMILVACALFGTSALPQVKGIEIYITILGVAFLLAMGLTNLIKGTPRLAYPKTRFGNFIYYFSTGFLLNGLNPVNFITWVALSAYLSQKSQYDLPHQITFLSASIISIFIIESCLAIFAQRLKPLFTTRIVWWFNKTTGLVFIGIALQLAWTRLYGPLMALIQQP